MITHLYRYPVKGLSGESLQSLRLEKQRGIPSDRAIAVARKPGVFDPAAPVALTKDKFLMLMRDAALARLTTRFDDASRCLIIYEGTKHLFEAQIDNPAERAAIAAFLGNYIGDDRLDPIIVESPGHQFTDISVVSPDKMRAVSLINLASINELSAAIEQPIDHRRFRANIYFDGPQAWSELDWLDREISLGKTRLKVTMRTRRCAATQVNPDTAERDINVPAEIKRHFGHFDMGVYAEVIDGGDLVIGDALSLT